MKVEVWLLVLWWCALAGSGRALAFAPIAIERRYIVQCSSITRISGRRGNCILYSSADPSSNDLDLVNKDGKDAVGGIDATYKKPPSTFFAAGAGKRVAVRAAPKPVVASNVNTVNEEALKDAKGLDKSILKVPWSKEGGFKVPERHNDEDAKGEERNGGNVATASGISGKIEARKDAKGFEKSIPNVPCKEGGGQLKLPEAEEPEKKLHAASKEANRLQQLLAACAQVFADGSCAREPAELAIVSRLLDELSPQDLGVDSASEDEGLKRSLLRYTDLYDSDSFTVTLFRMPPHFRLPLHSHPNITIISKVLRGKVNVSTFRTARPAATGGGFFFGGFMGAGGVKANTMLGQVDLEPHFLGHILSAASGVCVVRPIDSEYIEYATEDAECVILDVLTPPYFLDSWTDRRECKYFDCERGKDGNWPAKPLKFTKFSLVPTEAVAYEGIPAFGHDSVPSTEKFSRFGGR